MTNNLTTRPHARLDHVLPPVPADCVQWCRNQHIGLTVFEDSATVDLDWWNRRLGRADIPITLLGRGPDGELVASGRAELTRLDLWKQARYAQQVHDSPFLWDDRAPGTLPLGLPHHMLPDPGHVLTTLYLVAAWASAHPRRRMPFRFTAFAEVDEDSGLVYVHPSLLDAVVSLDQPGFSFDQLMARGQYRNSYQPRKIRGLGWQLSSYLLSVLSVRPGARRVVPMSPAALNMLVRSGWHEFGAEKDPNSWDYLRYQEAVRLWAESAGTSTEMVEMWLTESWHALQVPVVSDSTAADQMRW